MHPRLAILFSVASLLLVTMAAPLRAEETCQEVSLAAPSPTLAVSSAVVLSACVEPGGEAAADADACASAAGPAVPVVDAGVRAEPEGCASGAARSGSDRVVDARTDLCISGVEAIVDASTCQSPFAAVFLAALPGNDQNTLVWLASTNRQITEYQVWRGTTPGGETYHHSHTAFQQTGGTWNDTLVMPGQPYYYKVCAYAASTGSCIGWSQEAWATPASTGADIAYGGGILMLWTWGASEATIWSPGWTCNKLENTPHWAVDYSCWPSVPGQWKCQNPLTVTSIAGSSTSDWITGWQSCGGLEERCSSASIAATCVMTAGGANGPGWGATAPLSQSSPLRCRAEIHGWSGGQMQGWGVWCLNDP